MSSPGHFSLPSHGVPGDAPPGSSYPFVKQKWCYHKPFTQWILNKSLVRDSDGFKNDESVLIDLHHHLLSVIPQQFKLKFTPKAKRIYCASTSMSLVLLPAFSTVGYSILNNNRLKELLFLNRPCNTIASKDPFSPLLSAHTSWASTGSRYCPCSLWRSPAGSRRASAGWWAAPLKSGRCRAGDTHAGVPHWPSRKPPVGHKEVFLSFRANRQINKLINTAFTEPMLDMSICTLKALKHNSCAHSGLYVLEPLSHWWWFLPV